MDWRTKKKPIGDAKTATGIMLHNFAPENLLLKIRSAIFRCQEEKAIR